MLRCLTWIPLFLSISIVALSQTQPKETANPADKDFPTTLQPVNPVKYYGPHKEKKRKNKTVTYNARKEYQERMEDLLREQDKREKRFELGGGTDYMKPPYFGHKKAPKIRPIGKRRYCKICGIRH